MNFDLRDPDTFLAGTVGPPGQRIFFLQASEAGHVISLKLEKEQVWALASLMSQLLDADGYDGPAAPTGELVEPVAAAWTVGRLAVGVDNEIKIIVLIADEIPDEQIDDDDEDPGDEQADELGEILGGGLGERIDEFDLEEPEEGRGRARFHLDYAKARGFTERALMLVDDGRDFGMRNGHRPLRR